MTSFIKTFVVTSFNKNFEERATYYLERELVAAELERPQQQRLLSSFYLKVGTEKYKN